MVLTRWDPNAPLSPHNLVLIQQTVLPFVESLQDPTSQLADSPLTPDVVTRINERLRWARGMCEDDWPPLGIPEKGKAIQQKSSVISSFCEWVTAYRGPLLLLPSTLALITLTLRAKKR
jgi:hypothetical protein